MLGSRLLTPSVVLFGSLVPSTTLMFTGGMLLLGWHTWRARVLPPSVGLVWMAGIALLFAGAALQLGQALGAVGAVLLAYGFVVAGDRMWRKTNEARVPS